MLGGCWAIVYDAGPTLTHHWLNVSCLLGCSHSPGGGPDTGHQGRAARCVWLGSGSAASYANSRISFVMTAT